MIDYSAEHLSAQLWMGNLPTTKEYRDLHPLTPPNKLTNVSHLVHYIMWISPRSHLDFFDSKRGVFLRTMSFLFLFVTVLAIIHHAANWRLRLRRYLHQIEPLGLYESQRFMERQNTELLSLSTDDPHFAHANLMIDPRFLSASDKTPPFVVRPS